MFEILEARRLLSAPLDADGILRVTGTAGSDHIRVGIQLVHNDDDPVPFHRIIVQEDHAVQSFDADQVG